MSVVGAHQKSKIVSMKEICLVAAALLLLVAGCCQWIKISVEKSNAIFEIRNVDRPYNQVLTLQSGKIVDQSDISENHMKMLLIAENRLKERNTIPYEVALTASKSQGGDFIKVHDYVALSAISVPDTGDVAIVMDKGISGTFIYDDRLRIANNGGTIINGWVRQYDGLYLQPKWFGAAMDGTTDDRVPFVETLAYADTLNQRLLITKDILLDVEAEGTKSIFLEDNAWIEGENDANIIINNLRSPAFYAALTKDITLKNITILWDNSYDAETTYENPAPNITQLKNYLTATKGLVYNNGDPIHRGYTAYFAVLSLDGASNVLLDNVKFKAVGNNANSFIPQVIKLKEQHRANQTVTDASKDPTVIPTNITLKNVTLDGTIMGIQGIVDGFKSDGLKSYRYSDFQDFDGTNIGWDINNDGSTYKFPPPHLLYLNSDSSLKGYKTQNLEITNTIDFGNYVGTAIVRPTLSGYCNSLKLTGYVDHVLVKNYTSYRRDGLMDLQNITDGDFRNMYSESSSDIFDPSYKFSAIRFLGTLNKVSFENIIIKDNSEIAEIYPMNARRGNNVIWDNLNLCIKELSTNLHGCFGISGNNNTIRNSSLNIERHTSTTPYRGVIFHNDYAMNGGANNHYEITVNGWRNMDVDPLGLRSRMLFIKEGNPNKNYAKVFDTRNNYVVEQNNEIAEATWIRTETVVLGKGTEQQLAMNVPKGFAIKKVSAIIVEALDGSITVVSIGTVSGVANDLVSSVSLSREPVVNNINETSLGPKRDVYIRADSDFNNMGEVKVTFELIRQDLN